MKGLTRIGYIALIYAALVGFSAILSVNGSCATRETYLTATATPTMLEFTDNYRRKKPLRDENIQCRWIIRSDYEDKTIMLSFPVFKLQNSTKSGKGDCIEIYGSDGDDDYDEMLCDKFPQESYTSSGDITVVYTRGDVEGFRQLSMTYVSHSGFFTPASQLQKSSPQPQKSTVQQQTTSRQLKSSPRSQRSSAKFWRSTSPPRTSLTPNVTLFFQTLLSSQTSLSHNGTPFAQTTLPLSIPSSDSFNDMNVEKTVRIIGIIGAALASAGLIYIVLKVTKCCLCLRRKNNNGSSITGGSLRERVRLAHPVPNTDTHISINNQGGISQLLPSPPTNNAASATTSQSGDPASDNHHESDTESLQDMDEPPPSYESLYLDELGEPVSPPKYSPPVHRSLHPPRRANTFN